MGILDDLWYCIFDNGVMSLGLTWLVLYTLYFNIKVKHVPKVVCKPGKLKSFLFNNCPILKEVYCPTIWCFESRLQTIVQTLVRPIQCINTRREYLQGFDGGEFFLDWIDNDNDQQFNNDNRPTVLLLPGLVGSTRASYIQYMIRQVLPLGYRCVVLNYRGVNGEQLKTPRTYCASCTRDLSVAVEHVTSKLPGVPVMAAGFSLGGMILFNYVSRVGNQCPLVSIMTISSPWDPHKTCVNLETPLNYVLFNRTLVNNLLEFVGAHKETFSEKVNFETVMKSRSMREFDERFTTQIFNYSDVSAYYNDSKLTEDKVNNITIPTFCLASTDDPFIPEGSFPFEAIKNSNNVVLFLTSYGGHGGFLEGLFPWKKPNYMDRVFKEYVHAVFRNIVEKGDSEKGATEFQRKLSL